MDLVKLEQLARELMGHRQTHNSREKGHIFFHGRRTGLLARNLRPLVVPDTASFDNLIYLGGLYHDLGKGIEPHARSGVLLAREVLKEYLTEKDLAIVLEIIEKHNTISGEDHPFYVKLIQDADLLDHMGTLEVWLKFCYSSRRGESVENTLNYWKSDFYKKKLIKWRDRLNYEQARRIFAEKMNFLYEFIHRLERENNGEIINLEEIINAPE